MAIGKWPPNIASRPANFFIRSENMAGRKRGCSSAMGDRSSNDTSKKAKRQVTVRTFEKWQRELDREHHTLDWLLCERNESDHSLVATLW